jgi:hypothetical protein
MESNVVFLANIEKFGDREVDYKDLVITTIQVGSIPLNLCLALLLSFIYNVRSAANVFLSISG